MSDKKSFVLYTDYLQHLELLRMEQRGVFITAVMFYVMGRELPEMDGMTMMAFSFVKAQIDRDSEQYQKTVEARRAAGKLGGRPKADGLPEKQTEAKKANGFSEKQTEAKKPDNDNVNDNVTENKKQIMCDAAALFERLWKLYPCKKGKGQVSDAQKKRLLAVGEPALVKAIERYSSELQKDADWRKPQNGSTFFNSGYVDYLDENYSPAKKTAQKKPKNGFHNLEEHGYDYEAIVWGTNGGMT